MYDHDMHLEYAICTQQVMYTWSIHRSTMSLFKSNLGKAGWILITLFWANHLEYLGILWYTKHALI